MVVGFSIPTLLGSVVIVAALLWFVGAALRRLVGSRSQQDDRFK
jgi:hypothetical protein